MKYEIQDVIIPHDKRKEINNKILHIINMDLETNISKSDIYNAYTGDGGLHGLDFSDFKNFHEYIEAKKEIEVGQFFTPGRICEFLVNCVKPSPHDLVADLTCGMGNFFNFMPNETNIYGVEIDIKAYKVSKYLYPEANLAAEDIRFYNPDVRFDIVFGNPPFNLKWKVGKDEYLSQLYYCIKSYELLKPGGLMALIVPNSFLNDVFMDGNIIKVVNSMFNFVCQFDLPADSFKALGVNEFQTKAMFFQKKSQHLAEVNYSTDKISVPGCLDLKSSEMIYQHYLKPVIDQKEKLKAKLFFENVKSYGSDEKEFQYEVKKLLFSIKQHPAVNKNYAKCVEYVNRYYTQKKPEDMKAEEWAKVKLTKSKVLSYLRKTLKKQNEKEIDKIELVKTNYGIKLKAYSQKTKNYLAKFTEPKEMSINDMVLYAEYPFEDKKFLKLISRERRAFLNQNTLMKNLPVNLEITRFLNEFTLVKQNTGEVIKLNPIQMEDLGKVTQKPYSCLAWQQGSGKTIGGVTWYKFLLEQKKVRNVFIISNAISIHGNWDVELKNFGEDYIKIQSITDVYRIKLGQVVIISFDMLIKVQRHIKKYIRLQSKKVAVIVDESDEMTNHLSKRTRVALNCFRRGAAYKLLTTGTTTRNNINELYSQVVEFLYNNSINALCECEYVYNFNKDGELEEEKNPYFMKPFPAYHGKKVFKSCFSPHKITVFGVKAENQDIYNIGKLRHLIESTIITRRFAEIVGRKLYDIKVHQVKQNQAEQNVYKVIIEEFYKMMYYFRSTGNSRKDSMLRIIRQIQLLIKSTSTPHKFAEYCSCELPSKYRKILEMINQFKGEKVAIGTVFIETAADYFNQVKENYPDRPVFLIKGDVSFKKRKHIISQFEATVDGVLISTQQSLKSSVNIPTCNRIVLESLQWNIPKMSQYWFRFIRFNSTQDKEIHIVTYDNTIEQNIIALLLAKERINDFVQTMDFKEQSEIFAEFNVDIDILDNIIEKYEDEDGKIQLNWGKQKIS